MSDDCLFSVCLTTGSANAALIEEACELQDWNMTSWSDVDSSTDTFQEYFETEDGAALRLAEVDSLPCLKEFPYELELKRIENRDWTEYWKRFFHTEKVSEHLVIKPSWEEYSAGAGEIIIEIDPGMSFGTGQHPTTRMCLSILDEMSGENQTMIDLGCGSGILSIAAVKLGYRNLLGLDHDPLAIEIATENAAINNVKDQTDLQVADMDTYEPENQYDVVVINMLASLLSRFAEGAVRCMKPAPDSRLIVSGMLEEQYEETISLYQSQGLKVIETRILDGWKCALCARH